MRRGRLAFAGVLLLLPALAVSCSSCSPVYVVRAGWAELAILRSRRPLREAIADTTLSAEVRRKLLLARQARAFAIFQLGLEAGDAYTTFAQLRSDTLAWVLSAAPPDRLEPKTWWFPIVGRVPYRGYFDRAEAEDARRSLEEEGFDTLLRPTSAFSTLGWFADPLLSTLLRYDDVQLVSTVLHELTHNHIFLPGQVRFNESLATFVGHVGAIRFFCGPSEPVPHPLACADAKERWESALAYSAFLDAFVAELQDIYTDPTLDRPGKLAGRDRLRAATLEKYESAVDTPGRQAILNLLRQPLNNAVLLSRMRYYHRLGSFQALLDAREGDLAALLASLKREAQVLEEDPFRILPELDGSGEPRVLRGDAPSR